MKDKKGKEIEQKLLLVAMEEVGRIFDEFQLQRHLVGSFVNNFVVISRIGLSRLFIYLYPVTQLFAFATNNLVQILICNLE